MIATLSLCLALLISAVQPISLTITSAVIVSFEDKDLKEGRKAFIAGDYQKAVKSFSRYAEMKPEESDAHYYLGLSYRAVKRYDDAVRCFEQSWKLDQRHVFAPYELGKTFLEMKNYEAAMERYKWLQANESPFAAYLRDQFPLEMLEKYGLQPSLPIYKPKKNDNHAPAADKPATQNEAAERNQVMVMPAPINTKLRPKMLYTERAKYTEIARRNMTQGTVVLSVVFSQDGSIKDIGVIRALPDGLTRNAIEAAQKIRFQPAVKDGQPVSVRGNIEFNFTLY